MIPENLFKEIPSDLPEELSQILVEHGGVTIERIVSRGHASEPGFWYDQERNEWVMLLQGRARLRFEEGDRLLEMGPGSHVTIAAHERHRVEWTSDDEDAIWLAVFY